MSVAPHVADGRLRRSQTAAAAISSPLRFSKGHSFTPSLLTLLPAEAKGSPIGKVANRLFNSGLDSSSLACSAVEEEGKNCKRSQGHEICYFPQPLPKVELIADVKELGQIAFLDARENRDCDAAQ